MVYYFTPYDLGKNIGKAYNKHMALIPNDDDWGCLMDGDCCFLTPDWGSHINTVIKQNPTAQFFTCMTNRVGNLDQCYNRVIDNTFSILALKDKAVKCKKDYGHQIRPAKLPISGLFMLVKKELWNKCKFKEDGLLGVDNHYSMRAKKEHGAHCQVISGLYIFHYYRLKEGIRHKDHLK